MRLLIHRLSSGMVYSINISKQRFVSLLSPIHVRRYLQVVERLEVADWVSSREAVEWSAVVVVEVEVSPVPAHRTQALQSAVESVEEEVELQVEAAKRKRRKRKLFLLSA